MGGKRRAQERLAGWVGVASRIAVACRCRLSPELPGQEAEAEQGQANGRQGQLEPPQGGDASEQSEPTENRREPAEGDLDEQTHQVESQEEEPGPDQPRARRNVARRQEPDDPGQNEEERRADVIQAIGDVWCGSRLAGRSMKMCHGNLRSHGLVTGQTRRPIAPHLLPGRRYERGVNQM